MSDYAFQVISMTLYFAIMIGIGFWAYSRTKSVDDYMLGGRQLNPMVAALSAGASDMSGWLLMGLPGALYLRGLVEFWIAIGLTTGAWLNWKFVAPRLRSYTEVSNNSITVPSFLDSRLRDNSHALRVIAGLIILFYFTFYVSAGMVSGGWFFEGAFGIDYRIGMLIVAGVTVVYTLIGGFLAVSYTDMVQGLMMLFALIMVPAIGIFRVGGFRELGNRVSAVDPNMLSWFGGATAIGLISAVAWGLGYFGQPHIIVRFMALRSSAESRQARRISIGWMLLSCLGALGTAFVGVAILGHNSPKLPNPEQVFIVMGQLLFHPLIAGFMLAAILAAIMSTVSSQLLVSSSALVEDVYMTFTSKKLSTRAGMWLSRLCVAGISIMAAALAWTPNDTILQLVAFSWAGFGASFGPIILLALFWKRLSSAGALSGMVVGAATVAIWGNISGGIFDLYEIVPGFLFNLLVAVVVSLFTYKENSVIDAEFSAARSLSQGKTDYDAAKEQVDAAVAAATDGYIPRSATLVDDAAEQ
ncbi:MAG: sodium/proline symporter PutP [Trueperella sp.]|nr:sodium/proline symporter PutP [Trueperella sp.]